MIGSRIELGRIAARAARVGFRHAPTFAPRGSEDVTAGQARAQQRTPRLEARWTIPGDAATGGDLVARRYQRLDALEHRQQVEAGTRAQLEPTFDLDQRHRAVVSAEDQRGTCAEDRVQRPLANPQVDQHAGACGVWAAAGAAASAATPTAATIQLRASLNRPTPVRDREAMSTPR